MVGLAGVCDTHHPSPASLKTNTVGREIETLFDNAYLSEILYDLAQKWDELVTDRESSVPLSAYIGLYDSI